MSNEAAAFVIFAIFGLLVLAIIGERQKSPLDQKRRFLPPEENPDVNTRNWELHQKRLEKFGRSKYKGTTFYVGPKGGVYYITYRGTKVYC